MTVDSVSLANFRNYTKRSFVFSPGISVIIGENASGKTNILEAVYMAASGKSFRADHDRDVICWDESVGRVTAKTDDVTLELVLTSGIVNGRNTPAKRYLVGGVPRRQVDFVGKLAAVVFWPNDLELVTDSPSIRRKYLNAVLSQADREYHRSLLSYERALRQRNTLLELIGEGKAKRSQLLFWDQLLIREGSVIHDAREAFIGFVNGTASDALPYRISYDHSIISEARLSHYADAEIASHATLVGPHRDDVSFWRKDGNTDREVARFGSRGQQRLAVLWLKLAELAFVERERGTRPVLLLDDILSELDDYGRALVIDAAGKQQTIMTSAEESVLDAITSVSKESAAVIRLPGVKHLG